MDIGSLSCAQIWVRAVHTKRGSGINKSAQELTRRDSRKKTTAPPTLPHQGIEPMVFGFPISKCSRLASTILLIKARALVHFTARAYTSMVPVIPAEALGHSAVLLNNGGVLSRGNTKLKQRTPRAGLIQGLFILCNSFSPRYEYTRTSPLLTHLIIIIIMSISLAHIQS